MTHEIWDRFCKVAEQQGGNPALIDANTSAEMSYRELVTTAEAMANDLAIRPERAVVVVGEPEIEALPLVLACAAADCCIIPLSEKEAPKRILELLHNMPGPLLVGSRDGYTGLEDAEVGSNIKRTGLLWQVSMGTESTDDAVPFLVTHSSGSTGFPKAVAFSQATKLRRTLQSVSLFDVTSSDVILSPSALSHSLGQRHFFLSMMTGATLVKAYPFNPNIWLKAVRAHDVTFAIPVSTHLKILKPWLLSDPDLLASFRCLVTSSAPAEPEFKKMILDNAEFEFWEIYGMTETACATAVRYKKGSDTLHLGQAVPGTEIRIDRHGESKNGEIEVRSKCLCDGYWNDPDRWSQSVSEDGFFRSGDLGCLNENGNLIFLGRTNESFESAGHVVFPAEIERVIAELPLISDCFAFGLPDNIFGNLVAVAYTAKGEIGQRDLLAHARMHLPKHLWPARLFYLEEFPTLSSGKVDRLSVIDRLSAMK